MCNFCFVSEDHCSKLRKSGTKLFLAMSYCRSCGRDSDSRGSTLNPVIVSGVSRERGNIFYRDCMGILFP